MVLKQDMVKIMLNKAKTAPDSIDFQRYCAIQKRVEITFKEIP